MTNSASRAQAALPISPPALGPFRALAHAALFLVACAAVCTLLRAVSPFPPVPAIAPKWDWFQERRDEFEVLFVGSSRFYHQVIPQQFDAEVARDGGAKVRSFNFSYDAVWPPESYYLLRQILTLRPAHLKWVFIELQDIDFRLDDRNDATLRMSYWHDLPHTRMAIADILASRLHGPEKRRLIVAHSLLFLREAANLGRGADLLGNLLSPPPPRKSPHAWEPFAGYRAGTAQPFPAEEEEKYFYGVAQMKALGAPVPVRPVFREALQRIVTDVRQAGAEPIFVLTPTINPVENYGDIPGGAPVWLYNDPDQYPALYELTNHYDSWHLNHQGAIEFTSLLAARFAALTRRHP